MGGDDDKVMDKILTEPGLITSMVIVVTGLWDTVHTCRLQLNS